MGHMYPVALSRLMSELSPTTLNECVLTAIEREIGVSCAEGTYTEPYMYKMAFESLLSIYVDSGEATFDPSSVEEKYAAILWREGKLINALHIWKRILRRTLFTISDDVVHIEHIEN